VGLVDVVLPFELKLYLFLNCLLLSHSPAGYMHLDVLLMALDINSTQHIHPFIHIDSGNTSILVLSKHER
jgi:hypothetical protein